MAEVRDLARLYTVDAVAALVDVARSAVSPPAARVAAARELLDRAWGRPRPSVEAGLGPLEEMEDEELAQLVGADDQVAEAAALVGVRLLERPIAGEAAGDADVGP